MTSNIGDTVRGGYWLQDDGRLEANHIKSSLFTHLFCAFASLKSNNRLYLSENCKTFPRKVRENNHNVKTLLSIGGGAVGSEVFNNMASQPASRRVFIHSSIEEARTNGYDGLDLDWEGQTAEAEMANLATLLTEWRAAVDVEALNTGRQRLILTAAVSVLPQMYQKPRFPTAVIDTCLDWVNVMAYDFYNPSWSSKLTEAPASLLDPTNRISGTMGINAWIGAGVPAKRLVFGLPFYGFAWKLLDPNNHGILAPADGIDSSIGNPDGGWVAYRDIMQRLVNERGATVIYDGDYVTNYCYSGTSWVGYDDKQTITAKVQYAKSNLRGYFAWHLGQDDTNWTLSTRASQAWGQQ